LQGAKGIAPKVDKKFFRYELGALRHADLQSLKFFGLKLGKFTDWEVFLPLRGKNTFLP